MNKKIEENVIRYERLSKKDPEYKSKFKKQLEQSSKDAKGGKILCISDLMINAGM